MIDLNAPIVPGESAAGINLGSNIQEVLADAQIEFLRQAAGRLIVYRSASVDIWVVPETGHIHQIGVHGHYTGKLMGQFGIGSVKADVETRLGQALLDDEDNLIFESVPGLCFEIDVDAAPSTITDFYIYNV